MSPELILLLELALRQFKKEVQQDGIFLGKI
jgi:hypothetical protein